MAFTFDGPNKLIILSAGTVSLSVKDLWSRWVDWYLTSDNGKYLYAMTLTGGEVISSTTNSSIPSYVFLSNGWKIRPQEADHSLVVVEGILLTEDSSDPFVDTLGPYTVRVNYQQPMQAIAMQNGGTAAQLTALNDKIDQLNVALSTIDIPTAQENAQALLTSPVDPAANTNTIGGFLTKVVLTVPKYLGLS